MMRAPTMAAFSGTRRFRILDTLGKGGMGIVYRARDEETQRDVALKTLRRVNPEDLRRLKDEFRLLAGILHPNLVELHELFVEDGVAFFTMEVIEGVGFLDYVWGDALIEGSDVGPSAVVRRVEAALPQLAQGVAALHRAGRLHRDIKPSNIMVARDGRVVLLDFGLARALDDPMRDEVSTSGVFGTWKYMSPEQARGEDLTPASDWYSLGVALYEALAERLPARDTRWPEEVAAPVPLATLAPHTPPRLASVVMDLLARDPSQRPDAEAIARRLAHARPTLPEAPAWTHEDALFVGRDRERAQLLDAFAWSREHGCTVVRVEGASGIGKTELVRRVVAELERGGAAVLQARCHPRETVPYKALDGIVDGLARRLLAMGDDAAALRPADVRELVRMFPVLGGVPSFEADPSPTADIDPRALRRKAFVSLRALLGAAARARPLALWIDDAQWGDADSAALIEELLAAEDAPPLLLVASLQTDVETTNPLRGAIARAAKALDARTPGADRVITVEPIAAEHAQTLARRLLPPGASDAQVRDLVDEAGGSPFFLGELARHLVELCEEPLDAPPRVRLTDVVQRRLEALCERERALLDLVAVSGRPVERALLLDAAGVGAPGRRDVSRLTQLCLLRPTEVDGRPFVETYHNRVRVGVLDACEAARRRGCHRRLADALRALDESARDLDALVFHLDGAGETAEAARFAWTAAGRAADALAFDRAAAHYRTALGAEVPGVPRRTVLRALAEALVNAGRGGEAAEAFLSAADALEREGGDRIDVLDLRRRAAEQFLCSGRYDDGMRTIRPVLAAVGVTLPASPGRAMASGVVGRLRFFLRGLALRERPGARLDRAAAQRLDALWTAVVGFSMVQPAYADALGVQHLLETLDLAEPSRAVRALGYEASTEASFGGPLFRPRSAKILRAAHAIAARTHTPYDRAWMEMAEGTSAWLGARWADAASRCEAALALYRGECRGVAWEVATSEIYLLSALALLGRIRDLSRRIPEVTREAESRNDLYARDGYLLGQQAILWLAEDRVAAWREAARRAEASWVPGVFNLQRYQLLVASTQADLYEGDGAAAWTRMRAAWPELAAAQLHRLECARVELLHLRARAAIASSSSVAEPGESEAQRLDAALADAKEIAKSDIPTAAPFAAAIRAGVAARQGRAAHAARHWQEALEGFSRASMGLYVEAVRARVGDARARDEALARMTAEGVRDPARMTAMLVP